MRAIGRPASHGPRAAAPESAPLIDAEFVGSFPDPLVPLSPTLPEVALVGRSNVGKSSLLNALTGKPGLARVSATPGKTTLLNVYRLPRFYLVDLPGYGFARAGKAARRGYRQLLMRYLTERTTLAGVVWLLDVRRDPSPDDFEMQQQLVASGHPVVVALTKADKLGRTAARMRATALIGVLGVSEDQVQLTSSRSGLGIGDLAASMLAAIGGDQ
jgi:GTP-binding protein